jgi:hypothetical protein
MVSKQKIILMTKLAMYDKRHGDADRAAYAFFRRDYIYRKNMATRFCVGVGAGILLAVYWLNRVFFLGEDLMSLDFVRAGIDAGLFVLAVMAVYTVLGTMQGTRQYYLVQKRMNTYMAMLKRLTEPPPERPERSERRAAAERQREELTDLYYGAAADNQRNPD